MKIKNNFNLISLIFVLFLIIPFFNLFAENNDLLSQEEILWLKNRNSTIIVYPEKNSPPFSHESSSGNPLGLSIDYIELIAEKIGAKIEYLPARSLSQILDDVKNGRGDVITSVIYTPERDKFLYFTDQYVNVSSVIVARKDSNSKDITLANLAGKRVAVAKGRAVVEFLRTNYPRIILDQVTDDEIGLQQVVLGEVDFAIMDIASLSYYLSKQVLSSVNIVGNVGYSYKMSFAVAKDKQILQSILDKGLTQISQNERDILREKWIITPEEKDKSIMSTIKNTLTNDIFQYNFFLLTLFILFFFFFKRKDRYEKFMSKKEKSKDIKNEVEELANMSEFLEEELTHIKETEEKLKDRLEEINK